MVGEPHLYPKLSLPTYLPTCPVPTCLNASPSMCTLRIHPSPSLPLTPFLPVSLSSPHSPPKSGQWSQMNEGHIICILYNLLYIHKKKLCIHIALHVFKAHNAALQKILLKVVSFHKQSLIKF